MRAGQWCVMWLGVAASPAAFGQVLNLPAFQQKIAVAFNASGSLPAYVELSGPASWVAGSQKDSGTIDVQTAATGTIGETWSFSKISHTYTQSALDLAGLTRTCVYTDNAAKQKAMSDLNCQRAIPWFLPSFVLQPALSSAMQVTDVTEAADTANGQVKLRYTLALNAQANAPKAALDGIARIKTITAITVDYDALTALPSKLVYGVAFDDDDSRSVEASVNFSNYSLESGYMVPHHIQRFLQRTLQVDFNISSVTIR